MKEELKEIQCKLIEMMEEALEKPEEVCTKELYEVMDIVKDISETLYYHTITEAMEEGKEMPMNYHKTTPSMSAKMTMPPMQDTVVK